MSKLANLLSGGALSLTVLHAGASVTEYTPFRNKTTAEVALTKAEVAQIVEKSKTEIVQIIAQTKAEASKTAAEIVAQTKPATVLVTVFNPDGGRGLGAGWFVNKDGDIVTAEHVTSGAAKVFVTTADGEMFPAELIGSDKQADVAVIRIHANGDTPYLSWGRADLRAGDEVIEIGNPFGAKFTATFGHVSALHRNLGSDIDMLQYDAATNPGNSGGPVVNAKGQVVGLADMIVSATVRMDMNQNAGLAFAVPEDRVHKAVTDILAYGEVVTGQPRFTFEDATKPDKKFPVSQAGTGAVVLTVDAASASDKSGLKEGDIIVSFDDRKITDADDLTAALYLTHPGDRRTLTVVRDGEKHEIELVLGGDALPSHPLPPKPKALAAMAPQ